MTEKFEISTIMRFVTNRFNSTIELYLQSDLLSTHTRTHTHTHAHKGTGYYMQLTTSFSRLIF